MGIGFEALMTQIVGENPTCAQLVAVLSIDRFLVSAIATRYTDRQVRLAIIERLARIGDPSALNVLKAHQKAYARFGDQLIANAAADAISAIEHRENGRQCECNGGPVSAAKRHTAQGPSEPCVEHGNGCQEPETKVGDHELQEALLALCAPSGLGPSLDCPGSAWCSQRTEATRLLEILSQIRCEANHVKSIEDYLLSDPEDVDRWINVARVLREGGHFHGALEAYDVALCLFPPDFSYKLWSNRGLLLLCWERYQEAIESLRMALTLRPDYSRAHFFLGQAYELMHQFGEAVAHYQSALATGPDDEKSWNNIGVCQQQLGNDEDAVAAYEASLSINPHHEDALFNLAAFHCAKGSFEPAIRYVDMLIQSVPDDLGAKALRESILKKERKQVQTRDTFAPRSLMRLKHGTELPSVLTSSSPFSMCTIISPVNYAIEEPDCTAMIAGKNISHKGSIGNRRDVNATESPMLFISYKWESSEHCSWVIELAKDLHSRGYRVALDRFDSMMLRDGFKDKFENVILLKLDRMREEVPDFVHTIAEADFFVPILTEPYRRCVEPMRRGLLPSQVSSQSSWIPHLNPDDGWVFDEWQLALRLLLEGSIKWKGVWRSGPVLPPPFTKQVVCDLRKKDQYAEALDAHFPVVGRCGG